MSQFVSQVWPLPVCEVKLFIIKQPIKQVKKDEANGEDGAKGAGTVGAGEYKKKI